ncbi:MAG: Porphyromonas-type peptidyl-arginine deiminase, partial [Deltaproteobacteria bacterium]|nr:Porphyromonas-type peptidyl-arginine deiminase [Deltaproteobacteria bacterium]
MPAEWEPHAATWLGWPHNASDWPGKVAVIPWVYGEMVRRIATGETARIIVGSAAREAR